MGCFGLRIFKKKLNANWITTAVPDEENISFHHLGDYKISKGKWLFNNDSFYDHVLNIIKELNPKLENLFGFYGSDVVKKGKVNYAKLPIEGNPTKLENNNDISQDTTIGTEFKAFIKERENVYFLCNISVFADESIIIDNIPNPIQVTLKDFKNLVSKNSIISDVKKGNKIKIYGLGEFEISAVDYTIEINDIIGEIEEAIDELNLKFTSSEICMNSYKKYIENPSNELKETLTIVYENVAEHLKMYILGDMDLKDMPIREIIYGDE